MASSIETNYGTLMDRVKSLTIDSVVIMGFGLIISLTLNKFENTPDYLRGLAFIFVFFLYDPLFISSFGGTIGHLLIGLRVKKDKDHSRKILLPVAILRFIIKILLGWVSLITVTGNEKNKSIHDMTAGSVVIKINNQ